MSEAHDNAASERSPLEMLAQRIVSDAARDRAELHDHWDLWAVPKLRQLLLKLRSRPDLIEKVHALLEAETPPNTSELRTEN